MRWRPVLGVGWDDQDVPVEPHLLAVVLADVGVVPVGARVGEADLVGEGLSDRDRGLCLVRPVEAVFESEAVPVHGRLVIAFVRDVDDDLRVLLHLERRAGDRAVVGEHAHGVLADPFRDGLDPKVELVPVLEVDDLGTRSFGQTGGLSGKWSRASRQPPPLVPSVSCSCGSRSGGRPFADASICSAMNSASSLTQPMSAEPRVYCHGIPRK